jgi:histidine ammonia-lyase
MRALTEGAALPARIQDPFCLRALPQAHGPVLDALDQLAGVVTAMANAPSENPVLLPPDIAHHGGFHAIQLGLALDGAALAVARSASLSLSRLNLLVDPAYTGLTPFLAEPRPGASGVMLLEYVCASALADLRAAATPASLQTADLSMGTEDDAGFATLAARQAMTVAERYRGVLACELVAALRALRMLGALPAPILEVAALCSELPAEIGDRDLTDDLRLAERLLPVLAHSTPAA